MNTKCQKKANMRRRLKDLPYGRQWERQSSCGPARKTKELKKTQKCAEPSHAVASGIYAAILK